ncbi:MAG: DNA recombination protein RmuC [Bdellovibrionales bacterium]
MDFLQVILDTQLQGLLIGGATGFLIGAFIFMRWVLRLEREKAQALQQFENMGQAFDGLAQDALRKSTEQFLQLAQEKMTQSHNNSAYELEKRQKAIAELIDPVNKTLSTMDEKLAQLEKARLHAYSEIKTQITGMNENQARLRQETSSLVQALRSPSARGQWGEMQLKRCLEMAGLVEGVHFHQQVSVEGQRPDVVIELPGGKQIIIDAKAPIDAYLNAFKDDISDSEQSSQLDAHARHVKEHLKKLGTKAYWENFDSPEFVIMFLPGESYFSAALERDPSLIEAGVDQKVIPASPTTLISLCKAVMYGWSQEKLADSAREISELGQELYKRVSVFGGHMDNIGKGLERAISSYNQAIGSLESNVLPQARRFKDYQVAQGSKEIDAIKLVETTPRELSSPELTASKKVAKK